MKKVMFAWVTFAYMFDTEEELNNFRVKNRSKYWHWEEASQEDDGRWYIEVHKPYNDKYNPGW